MGIPAAVLGASGYGGAEILRLLAGHPEIDVAVLTAESQAGRPVTDLYPHLATYDGRSYDHVDDVRGRVENCAVVFAALPHGESMRLLPGLVAPRIVDFGADFRLDDAGTYEDWYGEVHAAPDSLTGWVYGLTELFRDAVAEASRVANPGCYPTAVTLAVAPLLKAGLIEGEVVVDAVSGLSGAGRAPKGTLHFAHADEDVRAYKVAAHQHTPEMELGLRRHAGRPVTVSFTAHLAPMTRGIHATCSARLTDGAGSDDVLAVLHDTYDKEAFVRVVPEPPGTKEVRGSNSVAVSATVDGRARRVIVTSVLDNLVKGAAGQALQNANLMLGLDEGLGLTSLGMYP